MKELYNDHLKDAPWPSVAGLALMALSYLFLLWAFGVIIIQIIKQGI